MKAPYRDKNGFYHNPHVVILGAGASRAAFPHGDKNGKKLPLMNDLIKTLKLDNYLQKIGVESTKNSNFESIYSDLFVKKRTSEINYLNKAVYDYFDDMVIVDEVTIYDEIILSLRSKDLIATFNWDPLLFQAYIRNINDQRTLPQLAFLHGNVAVTVCEKDKVTDYKGYNRNCLRCGSRLEKSPLLYPVKEKKYSENEFIQEQWQITKDYLKNVYLVTIFGYSAPTTDVEAIKLFRESWQNNPTRVLANFSVIDKPDANREDIRNKWLSFSTRSETNDVGVAFSYRETTLFEHPRRSCEALGEATLQQRPRKENPLPVFTKLDDLQKWLLPLIEEENSIVEPITTG